MKASQRDYASVAAKAAATLKIFYFCGPDEAGAWQAAERIITQLSDPGERIELAGAELRRDPVRLGDEARSNSLFGDNRHIVVRTQGDEAHDAVETLLGSQVDICPVLIVASAASDKSRIAKLLAGEKTALVTMFYPPDLATIARELRTIAAGAGLNLDAAQAERIARAASLDIRLARSEVEKLALYLDASPQAPKTASQSDVEAVTAPAEDDSFAMLVDVVLNGEHRQLPAELHRFSTLGLSPVSVLLALERRAAQLAALAARLGPGGNPSALIESERAARRIFWKDAAALKLQLATWRGRRLERLVERLADLHVAMLSNSRDSDLLLAQALAEIARVARKAA